MARPVPMSGVFSERVYFSAFLVSDSLFQLSEASTLYEGSRLFLVPCQCLTISTTKAGPLSDPMEMGIPGIISFSKAWTTS
jgi:hypothetical protein